MNELFCEHIEYVLKTYGKSWLEAQYGVLILSKGQSQKRGQCTFDNSLTREYTIEDPKRKFLSKGMHL